MFDILRIIEFSKLQQTLKKGIKILRNINKINREHKLDLTSDVTQFLPFWNVYFQLFMENNKIKKGKHPKCRVI